MGMRRIALLLVPLLGLSLASSRAAEGPAARLPCIADTMVSSYSSERETNFGTKPRLRLKGIESLALVDFDTTAVRGRKVAKASLFLHVAGEHRLKTIGLSTVAVAWREGEGAEKTGASFDWAEAGSRRWGGRQSDVTDVTFGRQGTLHQYSNLLPREGGWLEVEVPPRFVEALASGASHGLAVTDEKGQTRWNNDVDAREQSGFGPYLLVTTAPGEPARMETPRAVAPPAARTVQPLASVAPVRWAGGEPPVHDGLRAWAYPDVEKAHPVSGNLLEETGEKGLAQQPAGEYRRRNGVWTARTPRSTSPAHPTSSSRSSSAWKRRLAKPQACG